MKKTHFIIFFATLLLATAFFVIIKNNSVIAETPICANTNMKAGEKVTCKIEAKNTSSVSLSAVRAEITIPNGSKIISHDSAWSCTNTTSGMTCVKQQNPHLVAGASDFLTITLRPSTSGTFNFSVKISGNEQIATPVTEPVTYMHNEVVDHQAAAPTADAVNDNFVPTFSINYPPLVTENVATNDTLCNFGTTTFAVVLGSEVNGAVKTDDQNSQWVYLFDSTGVFTFVGLGYGHASFDYNILCDGIVMDSATVLMDFMD